MAPRTSDTQPDAQAVQQAIAWMVRLQSGAATHADYEACVHWRAARADHERAWTRLEALGARVKELPSVLAHATLDDSAAIRRKYGRRDAMKALGLLAGIGIVSLAGTKITPWQTLFADFSTGIGERRWITLADGTRIHLNTHTALDARYDDDHRRVRLHRGEILITTARDPSARHRPFSVETRLGGIRALGTRFLVRDLGDTILVAVFEGAVEVTPDGHSQTVRIDAGEQWLFGDDTTRPKIAADPDAAAWIDGAIVARRMRLGTLVAELDRYYPGKLRCDPSVAALEISGVFPIEDPARVLAAIARTLPVRVDTFTPYWVTLRAAAT